MKLENSTDLAKFTVRGTTWEASASSVSFSVLGQCYSMKNGKSGHGKRKHPKAVIFERDFSRQVPPEAKRKLGSRECLLRAIITVWYPSWRQDGDFALIEDLLQRTDVISNDRWIRERHYWAEVDAKNPRCDITIEAI